MEDTTMIRNNHYNSDQNNATSPTTVPFQWIPTTTSCSSSCIQNKNKMLNRNDGSLGLRNAIRIAIIRIIML